VAAAVKDEKRRHYDAAAAVVVVVDDGLVEVVLEGVVVDDAGGIVTGPPKGTAVVGMVEGGVRSELVELVGEAGSAVSGLTQPAGGLLAPVWPGISTVPAQPKSEKIAWLPAVEPSANWALDCVSRT
jgi:hypothetical protein